MDKRRIRRTLTATLLLGAMLAGSVAFAAWLATGTGSGYARAITASDLSTDTVATVADLYPGGTGDVKIKIVNPNPYPVLVTDVVRTSDPITSDKGAACDASTGVTMTDQTGLSLAVPASGSATFTLAGAVSMSNASHTSCQGAVFTIPVQLSGQSNA
ncbi:MAG: hypothetical protein KatS3mg013_0688 [Actinomycetota bacterium]|jgi:hypothetical protein|nr:MAG: hypothetical protein KatS3mg013_0688 [Actinomycetota bacterium]